METRADFHGLWNHLLQDGNYQPRDYQTIGGMWTVDTWQDNGIVAQLMDEGWTRVIRAPGLIAVMTGDDAMRFDRGDGAVLAHLARITCCNTEENAHA